MIKYEIFKPLTFYYIRNTSINHASKKHTKAKKLTGDSAKGNYKLDAKTGSNELKTQHDKRNGICRKK